MTEWAEAVARADNPYTVAINRYCRAPVAFVKEILGADPDPWQLDVLRALARGYNRLAIRSAHGVGKTALASWIMLWFSATRAPYKCICTAPSAPQLFDALWPELLGWIGKLPQGWRDLWHITSDHITLKSDAECFISARTSRAEQPEAMQGIHSQNILLVADEASGIAEPVFEAASGSMSSANAITLLIGNPVRSTGFFWRCFMIERDRWYTRQVTGAESPRVSPGFMREMAERYGTDSNAYRIRCLGEFPVSDDDTLIGAELIDSAMTRDVPLDLTVPEFWGLDVARYGTDSSVLIKRRGNCVIEPPRRWRNLDLMSLAGAVKREYDLSANSRPTLVAVDSIGLGAGVCDRLAEQQVPVLAVNVSEQPSVVGRYVRLRDELWDRCREWLASRVVRLPKDDRLRDGLASPRFTFDSNGRLRVESKDSMRSRGLASPDEADALNLTFTQAGLSVSSGMTSGLYDSQPMRIALPGLEV